MDCFLCEVYDVPSIETLDFTKVMDVKGATLHYGAIYSDANILKNLNICWVWRRFFGVYPSKIDIYKAQSAILTNDYITIVNYVLQSTFAKYSRNVYEKNIQTWLAEFNDFIHNMEIIANIKSEIVRKLCDRFCINYNLVGADKTLWAAYKHIVLLYGAGQDIACIYQKEAEFISNNKLLQTNPFSGTTLQNNKIDALHFNCLTRYEAVKTIAMADFYFMRMCFLRCGFIAYEGDRIQKDGFAWLIKALSSVVKGKIVILTKHQDVLQQVTQLDINTHVFKCPFGDENMYSCVPSVFLKMVLHMPPTSYSKRSWSLTPFDTYVVSDNLEAQVENARLLLTLKDGHDAVQHDCILPSSAVEGFFSSSSFRKSLMELYLRTMNPYINIRFGERNVPECFVHVIDTLVRRCIDEKLDPSKLQTSPFAKNCVLVIDSRENPFSVMSTCITFSNLKPKEWNLVVMTSVKMMGYYKEAFTNPDIIYLTHPLLNKEPFELDDYNTIMKSTELWMSLQNFDNCLTIQDDGMLINKGIEETFLNKYDFVGAPWAKESWNEELATAANPMFVGNGGLSLRNVKNMIKYTSCGIDACKLFNNDLQPIPEDAFFANATYNDGGRIPDYESAKLFAVEQVAAPAGKKTLGFHKPWAYLTFQEVLLLIQRK
jgi:hypothetical protein